MDASNWVAVLGGIAGTIAAVTTAVKVFLDRRAGIDSNEISIGELELSQDEQSWSHMVEVVEQLRNDRTDLREQLAENKAALAELAVEVSALRSVARSKDDKILLLESDIMLLLEHINSGRQPPPPKLRGYRGEEETHE